MLRRWTLTGAPLSQDRVVTGVVKTTCGAHHRRSRHTHGVLSDIEERRRRFSRQSAMLFATRPSHTAARLCFFMMILDAVGFKLTALLGAAGSSAWPSLRLADQRLEHHQRHLPHL